MKTNKNIVLGLLIAFIITSVIYYDYFISQTSLEQRITAKNGYKLEQLYDNVSIRFNFQPEWLKQRLDVPQSNMKRVYRDDDTAVFIEYVIRQDERLCISLVIENKYQLNEGTFLSIHKINHDSSFTSENGKWTIVGPDGKSIDNTFGNGSGPGNRISIFIDIEFVKTMSRSTQIKYDGLLKYGYKRI